MLVNLPWHSGDVVTLLGSVTEADQQSLFNFPYLLRQFMKYILRLIAAVAMLSSTVAFAHDYTQGSIKIDHPWSRATVAGIPNGGAYFVLENSGEGDDRLVSASSPIADKVELHTNLKDGEVVRMRQVDAVDVPAGSRVALEPGGMHVMLMGLKEPLTEGASFPLTLVFDEAGTVTVDVVVELISGAKDGHEAMDHSHH